MKLRELLISILTETDEFNNLKSEVNKFGASCDRDDGVIKIKSGELGFEIKIDKDYEFNFTSYKSIYEYEKHSYRCWITRERLKVFDVITSYTTHMKGVTKCLTE